MNLQWLRQGKCSRTGLKGAGLVLAAWILTVGTFSGSNAWAQLATRIQLSAAHEAGASSQAVFTARVADFSGNAVSSGTVSFEAAKGSIGSAIVANGIATLHVDTLPPGTSTISAIYHGDGSFNSSTSTVAAQADAASTVPDFSLTVAPASLSLSPGDYGSILVTVTPINGFSEMVALSCSGNPAASTCVFSPTGITPLQGAVATSILQVQTQGPSGTLTRLNQPASDSHSGTGHIAYAIILPGMLALAGVGALRRRSGVNAIRFLGLALLLTASSLGLSSCSQRYNYLHKPPAANPGIAAGTYNITLAAYANNGTSVTSHTLNFTLTVK